MAKFFTPNIDRKGRVVRAFMALALIVGGIVVYGQATWRQWTCGGLMLSGAFVLFEAVRGWCFARACGVKTRL